MAGSAAAVLALAGAMHLAGVPGGVPAEKRDVLLALLCVPLGSRIAVHATRNACGWLVLAVGVLAAGTVGAAASTAAPAVWLRDWLWWPSYGLLILVVLVFPDGRPISRRWRPVVIGVAVTVGAGSLGLGSMALRAPGSLLVISHGVAPGWDTAVVLTATAALAVGAVLAVLCLVLRIRRTPAPGRGPLLWAAVNAILLLAASVLDAVVSAPWIWVAGTVAVPAAATIGIVRYGLYDISLLVHRSLLYGLLTVGVLAGYAGTVELAARVVPAAESTVVAAVTVIVLLPLRQGLQTLLSRTLYGPGSHPYTMVTMLGRRVGQAETPAEILAAAVSAVGEGLKVPFVAVRLGERSTPEATHGRRRPWAVTTLPLTFRGRIIGRLVVQQRGPDEPWSRRERTLLTDLCRQLGPPAASAGLIRDLFAARQRLVHAREEELRRLQRELHDGVGPALAGARMHIVAARRRAPDGSTSQTLARVDLDLAAATAEIRRIIDNLRPPALDRGLPAALDAAVRRYPATDLKTALHIRPEELGSLPAAVEVAAYRVVEEALANVARHAHATHAEVTVSRVGETLQLRIDDDGVGSAGQRAGGIGLDSMRERCQELGGSLRVAPRTPGTSVIAGIPLD